MRKSIFESVSAIVTLLAMTLVASAPASAGTTPSGDDAIAYQINAAHSGSTAANVWLPLHVRWSVPVTGTITYPLIADGRVYTTYGSTLVALDALSGKTDWTQTAQGSWVGAAFGSDRIYAESASPGSAYLFAFDARTGKQLWVTSLTIYGDYSFTSYPTALNGIVYTVGTRSNDDLIAMRASDGDVLWDGLMYSGEDTSPAVTATGVYVAVPCPNIYDFDPASGATLWGYSDHCTGGGGSVPVVDDGLVYVSDDLAQLYAGIILQANTGKLSGQFTSYLPVAASQGVAYALQFGDSNLTAINSRSGKVIWSVPARTDDTFMVPALVDTTAGLVFEGTEDGYLNGYRIATGKQIVEMNLGAPIQYTTSMAIGEGMIVLQSGSELVAVSGK